MSAIVAASYIACGVVLYGIFEEPKNYSVGWLLFMLAVWPVVVLLFIGRCIGRLR